MSWNIDYTHSEILFAVRHMMVSKVRGQFQKFNGTIDFDPAIPAATRVDVQIEANSIYTREAQRDAHLRSGDFLDAENYPTLRFVSDSIEMLGENEAKLHGNLTIREVTRLVTLDVEFVGMGLSPFGTEVAGFNAKTKINREDWGLVWNVALETGGWLVGKEIEISIEVELMRQAAAETAAVAP